MSPSCPLSGAGQIAGSFRWGRCFLHNFHRVYFSQPLLISKKFLNFLFGFAPHFAFVLFLLRHMEFSVHLPSPIQGFASPGRYQW
jgi:hypothetical protein